MRLTRFCSMILIILAVTAGSAAAQVCVAVDEARDTFSPSDRAAAVLLVAKQFEFEGEHVVAGGCANLYTVSHIALGNTIIVTLSGPLGRREGRALGIDDLPPLYNQMVRSLMTGRPMTGFNVTDRTNVTTAQSRAERVGGDSLWYSRLGYSSVFADRAYGAPTFGFGYRYELDTFGVDVSFLNFQAKSDNTYYSPYSSSASESVFGSTILKLQGLYFVNGTANKTPYFGAGLSYGTTSVGSYRDGNGLQAELSAGYEMPRASTLRTFVQADLMLPFYSLTSVRYSNPPIPVPRNWVPTATIDRRYAPSFSVSLGIGWGKAGRRG